MTVQVAVLVVAVVVTGVVVWQELMCEARRRSRRQWLERFGGDYASSICGYLFDDGPMPEFEGCDYDALLELLHSVCTLTSGYDPRRVARLSHYAGLDVFLQRRARSRAVCERAVYAVVALQTGLDVDLCPEGCRGEWTSRVLFATSAVRLTDNSAAVRLLAERTLSPIEVAMTLEMRSRRYCSTDYSSALHSLNPLVVHWGLAAVRRFRDEELADDVCRLVDTCDDELVREALYAWVALRGAVTRRSVARAVARLGVECRKGFYRHLAAEGYSSLAIEWLCSSEPLAELEQYATSLADSYKHPLDQPHKIEQL